MNNNINNNELSTHTLSNRKWYAENKEAILAYKKEKVQCTVCNKMVARGAMSKHKNSNYHKNILDKNNKLNELDSIRNNSENIDDTLFYKLKNLIFFKLLKIIT
jgi:hypothetical protein